MTIKLTKYTAAIWLASVSMVSVTLAADAETTFGPRAVSAPNGKIEFSGGYVDFDNIASDEMFSAAAAFSMPVGDTFGVQGDISVTNAFSTTSVTGTGHFFTRNPDSHLLGVIGGYADIGRVNAAFIGPEVELYLDSVSIEAVAGYMNLDASGVPSVDRLFAVGTVGFYATDDLRFTLGASSVAKFESAKVGFEWMASDLGLPASLKGDVRFGEDDFVSAEVGLTFYFGGNEPGKSLKRRHREDDPPIRALDIFGAGAAGVVNESGVLGDGDSGVAPDPCDVEFPDPEVCDILF